MSEIKIVNWSGRSGNNIRQILNAIQVAEILNIKYITFPSHQLLTSNRIMLDISNTNNISIHDIFFDVTNIFKKYDIFFDWYDLYLKKNYFLKYVYDILQKKLICNHNNLLDNIDINTTLFIHIRSEDCFGVKGGKQNCWDAPNYIQPPLSFYTKIIDNNEYDNIILVSTPDKKNPCCDKLIQKYQNKIKFISSSVLNDLNILKQAKYLIISYGSFCHWAYYLSTNLKKMYVPSYIKDYNHIKDIEIIKIDLEKYKENMVNKYFKDPYNLTYMLEYN
tara:strand:+ start:5952 stop:6782 length:831 start_codon:yes stop_codon:yes gene_type:complete